MQPISPEAIGPVLEGLANRRLYLHLETTVGAYTSGGVGAFVRGAPVALRSIEVRGDGPYRCGAQLDDGFIYAEGITHWEVDGDGRLLLEGYDPEGRLTVCMILSPSPIPARGDERRVPAGAPPEPGPKGCRPPSEERCVLAVQGHPDDESFSFGGTMRMYSRAGVPVTQVTVTLGEMGRNLGDPRAATRQGLRELRIKELRNACDALGVGDLWLLGVWDKASEFADLGALAARVAELIRRIRPSLVLTAHPVYGGHPDHVTAGRAAICAVRLLPEAERPVVHCSANWRRPEGYEAPVQVVDIAETRDAKLEALRRHTSQTAAMFRRMEGDGAPDQEMLRRFGEERYIVYPVATGSWERVATRSR